jgi:hypothetical protein
MNENRVLLMMLSEKTSAKGSLYMTGWLGKAKVVAFKSREPDKYGNEQWEVFVATPRETSQPSMPAFVNTTSEPEPVF